MKLHIFFSGHSIVHLDARFLMNVDYGLLYFKGGPDKTVPAAGEKAKEAPAATDGKKAEAEAAKKVDAVAANTGDAVKAVVPETGDTSKNHYFKWNYDLHKKPFFADTANKLLVPTMAGAAGIISLPTAAVGAATYVGWKRVLSKLPVFSAIQNKLLSPLSHWVKDKATMGYNIGVNILEAPLIVGEYLTRKTVKGFSTPLGLKGPDGQANANALTLAAFGIKHLLAAPFRAVGALGPMAREHPVWATAIAAGALQAMGINVAGWVGGVGKSIVTSMFT